MAKKNIDASTIDKRLSERLIRRGEFSESDFDAALKKLPDLDGAADNIADVVYASTVSASETPAE
jgi:hypothetical protein